MECELRSVTVKGSATLCLELLQEVCRTHWLDFPAHKSSSCLRGVLSTMPISSGIKLGSFFSQFQSDYILISFVHVSSHTIVFFSSNMYAIYVRWHNSLGLGFLVWDSAQDDTMTASHQNVNALAQLSPAYFLWIRAFSHAPLNGAGVTALNWVPVFALQSKAILLPRFCPLFNFLSTKTNPGPLKKWEMKVGFWFRKNPELRDFPYRTKKVNFFS